MLIKNSLFFNIHIVIDICVFIHSIYVILFIQKLIFTNYSSKKCAEFFSFTSDTQGILDFKQKQESLLKGQVRKDRLHEELAICDDQVHHGKQVRHANCESQNSNKICSLS